MQVQFLPRRPRLARQDIVGRGPNAEESRWKSGARHQFRPCRQIISRPRFERGIVQVGILPGAPIYGGKISRGAGTRLKRDRRMFSAGEHDLFPPPIFGEQSRKARRLTGNQSGPSGLWGRTTALRHFLESEPAEARALFRKQLDRPRRLRRKPSALRHWLVAQKQSARPISDRRRSVTVRANHFGGLIPKVGSRGANACGDSRR